MGGKFCLEITEGGLWPLINPFIIDGCGEGLRLCASIEGACGEAVMEEWRCICGEGKMTDRRDGVGEGWMRRTERGDMVACLIIMAVGVGIDGRLGFCCCDIIIGFVAICSMRKV